MASKLKTVRLTVSVTSYDLDGVSAETVRNEVFDSVHEYYEDEDVIINVELQEN